MSTEIELYYRTDCMLDMILNYHNSGNVFMFEADGIHRFLIIIRSLIYKVTILTVNFVDLSHFILDPVNNNNNNNNNNLSLNIYFKLHL